MSVGDDVGVDVGVGALARAGLDALLAEEVGAARERERTLFHDAARGCPGIVLVGAGGLGRRTLAGLRAAGVEPLGFIDSAPSSWGTSRDGLAVLPAPVAARRWPEAVYVVTIWGAGSPHRFAHARQRLAALGVASVLPVAVLLWAYAEQMLPFYALDLPSRVLPARAEVARAYELLSDDLSRAEYVSQVTFRLHGDPGVLAPAVTGPQYFPADLFGPRGDEVFIDCGAFDGDTLRAFLTWCGGAFARYLALEPDPANAAALAAAVSALDPRTRDRVAVAALAAADHDGEVRFAAGGGLSAHLGTGGGGPDGGEGDLVVPCARLDTLAGARGMTFVKMDIEGAEPAALAGAAASVRRAAPLMAVAAYHAQDHLWRVPLMLADLLPGHLLHLRPHCEEGWDTVCYAVPPDRVPPPR